MAFGTDLLEGEADNAKMERSWRGREKGSILMGCLWRRNSSFHEDVGNMTGRAEECTGGARIP